MITSNDFKNGMTIELDGQLMTIVEFLHVKPGKGSAFVRTKLKNLRTGYTVEKTFRAGEKLMRAHIEKRTMQFLYSQGTDYVFMDSENYEQITLQGDLVGDGTKWLKDGMEVSILFHDTTALGVEVPNFVELVVTETEPGFKGDTATGGTKPATLETGTVIQVPLFIEVNDKLQIDTRSSQYLRRV
ncbi:MAG: elongation factor P [Candidatus Eremiobacteraeota bacterium]|nr:elongation factor P [Candidatus Eremiobacteraeota bacterium]